MFHALDEKTVTEYILKSPIGNTIFEGLNDLIGVDLAEGNVNLVFRVYSKSNPEKSVIVKQALDHARRYPDFKMPQKRAALEAEMLKIENKYCPGLAPEHYYHDEEMYLNIMEDLNKHVIMRVGLMQQVKYPKFAEHLGTFLARTLFYTSDFYLPSAEKKEMAARILNTVMCKVTEDLIFTEPYIDHSNNHWTKELTPHVKAIKANKKMQAEALKLKESFMTHQQALIHGDLHTGSIMINQQETKVLDPEFAFFGPMGFDIGMLLANLVISHGSQEYHAKDENTRQEYREWLLQTIEDTWNQFESEFRYLMEYKINDQWPSELFKEEYVAQLLRDTAGFGAAEIIRRTIGMAHVPDWWEIPSDKERAVAESIGLSAAEAWMLHQHEVTSIKELVDMVREARPHPDVLKAR
ncbi:MAG: S-methyl-5-thioribose kinase [Promethearchaeota archaeon]